MRIRAVVFDVGNVLEQVDPVESWLATWQQRLNLAQEEFLDRWDLVDPQGFMGTGQMLEAEYRRRVQEALALSGDLTDLFMAEMWDWYCGRLDVEIVDFARSLRPAVRTAILGNSADGARREEQARYGFEQLVDVIVYSHEVGLEKPDPRIFQLTCERLAVRPHEAVLIDDVGENVEAAVRFGMHAVLHRGTPRSIAQVRDLLGTALSCQRGSDSGHRPFE